jgi:flavin-binding protein dodecin
VKKLKTYVERTLSVSTQSVYKIIELIGTSEISWEDAAKTAVEAASRSLHDLRIAEVKQLDLKVEDGKVVAYRAKIDVSFKVDLAEETTKS